MTGLFDPADLDGAIGDDDIAWAEALLGLDAGAFSGADGTDPRIEVLRAARSIDIPACPGSGKTTLLVAKLAILGRQWRYRRQGICVLSHTNVARMEIEKRLRDNPVGQAILGYPHFVGTIHGFINSFIALPWMRSQGFDVRVIDDDLCQARRWSKLGKARFPLEKNGKTPASLEIVDTGFGLGDVRWVRGSFLGRTTETYLAMVNACRDAAEDGFFCHADLFLWALEALDRMPGLVTSIRRRFPILFLDEVQDNQEAQARLLYRIFREGDAPVLRHRFGDMNQAIYGSDKDREVVETDLFPAAAEQIPVSNSHRFCQRIADAANPVAIATPALIGLKPLQPAHSPLVLMLFEPARATEVLPAYAHLIGERFAPDERHGAVFAAVGSVHRDKGDENSPTCVAHYWPDYDPQLAASERQPRRFLDFVSRGHAERRGSADIHPVIERVAEAMLHLAAILNPAVRHPRRASCHRQVTALLGSDVAMLDLYRRMSFALATGRRPATAEKWSKWCEQILRIAAPLLRGAEAGEAGSFLDWVPDQTFEPGRLPRRDNVFRHEAIEPLIEVKVGTIHSVKGETHKATLVLDTYFSGSHLDRIKAWLIGDRIGVKSSDRINVRKSLKQHYVAMTRPTDLLCVAMRTSSFTEAELARLSGRHWGIGDLVNGTLRWRA
ncbi:UvrD-helicase domain-containing protein [Allosphingosinicella humi]